MKRKAYWPFARTFGAMFVVWLLAVVAISVSGSFPDVKAESSLGGPLPNLTTLETALFTSGQKNFFKLWDPVHGLGPVFTNSACTNCHSQPVPGGNSPQKITLFGTTNLDGTFNPLTNEGGPLLQPISISKFQPVCTLSGETIPSDATIVAQRLSPPTFGSGLINSIDQNSILANAIDKGMGIHGTAGMVLDENGQTKVGRFGRKAQFADLLQFTSEALTHDLGITSPLISTEDLPQGQPIPPACVVAAEPNDTGGKQLVAIFHFEEYLAPSNPGTPNVNGQAIFNSIGCALCHLPSYTTAPSVSVALDLNGKTLVSKALSNQQVNLYSDLLLHDMGAGLADNIQQGAATGSQWRTTPLWGLSLRTQYLHDGRTSNLTTAIQDHGGEAQQVIQTFNTLSSSDQADLLTFISSL
jgi:CxxC motif-containing protein (DUF1111 family)